MSEHEREMLDTLGAIASAQSDIIQTLADSVSELNERVDAQAGLLETLGATTISTLVDASLAKIFASALLAEIAQGDRDQFDKVLAKTVIFVESHVGRIEDNNTKPMLLVSLDSILEMAEEAFLRGM